MLYNHVMLVSRYVKAWACEKQEEHSYELSSGDDNTRKLALVGYQAEKGFSSNSGKLAQSVTERIRDQTNPCYLTDCNHAGKIVRLQGLPLVWLR